MGQAGEHGCKKKKII